MALTLIPLGQTLGDLGDRDRARKLLERAFLIITEAKLGTEHPEARAAAAALGEL